ncbi:hypothetical protein H2204_001012 [Knufia peltigerae]|uniref:Transcription factor domain-containing protein n=1 Tax=Knufia peltigerae TaxID=1002370 RepID=A0AA38YDS0_9EURO|nr:hypothetical protein H2204_001012 [Knufia peltigerae]
MSNSYDGPSSTWTEHQLVEEEVQGASDNPSKSIAPGGHGSPSNGSKTYDGAQTGHLGSSDSHAAALIVPGKQQTDDSVLAASLGAPSGRGYEDDYTTEFPQQSNHPDITDSLIRSEGTTVNSETLGSYAYLEDFDSTLSQDDPLATSEWLGLFSPPGVVAEIQGSSQPLDLQENPLSPWSNSTMILSTRASVNQYSDANTTEIEDSSVGTTKHIQSDDCHPLYDLLSKRTGSCTTNATPGGVFNSIGPLQVPQQLSFNTATLLNHYFSAVCPISSCFDSPKNPFRTLFSEGHSSSELIYGCALSMSGAHLSCVSPGMKIIALNYQTQAISLLKETVARKQQRASTSSPATSDDLEELVIAIIMIGMSSPWHSSSIGVHHLQGGRILFRKWLDESRGNPPSRDTEASTAKRQSFLIGIMSYWEMLSSFVVDQCLEDLEYLETARGILNSATTQTIFPNPWTGICTPLVITLAKLGCLLRQNRLTRRLSVIKDAGSAQGQLLNTLLQDLQVLEKDILNYKIPSVDVVEDTADPGTTKQTLRSVAQIYQLTGLLELYTQVPEVFEQSTQAALVDGRTAQKLKDPAGGIVAELHHFAFRVAISILALISSIPISSGANMMLMVPLLSAGSRLQPCINRFAHNDDRMQFHGTPLTPLTESLVAFETHRAVDGHWRQFVRSRIDQIHRVVKLDSVQQAAKLMEAVWEIADAQNEPMSSSSQPRRPTYWMDVMSDKRLETLLG